MTTSTASSVHAIPAIAIAVADGPPAVGERVPDAEAYEDERHVLRQHAASTANTANNASLSSSRYQIAQRSAGIASPPGWNSLRASQVRRSDTGGTRTRRASRRGSSRGAFARVDRRAPRRARSRLPGRRAAGSGSATATRVARTRTSTGSTWAPRRSTWSPSRSATRSGWPCAVDHTACTMFPRSKRGGGERLVPAHRQAGPNSDQKVATPPQTARGVLRSARAIVRRVSPRSHEPRTLLDRALRH